MYAPVGRGQWCQHGAGEGNLAALQAEEQQHRDPSSLQEALSRPNTYQWRAAMEDEMQSLRENQTWELVEKPTGARVLPVRWVYKLKQEEDGKIRY